VLDLPRPPEASDGDPDALSLHSNDLLTPDVRSGH